MHSSTILYNSLTWHLHVKQIHKDANYDEIHNRLCLISYIILHFSNNNPIQYTPLLIIKYMTFYVLQPRQAPLYIQVTDYLYYEWTPIFCTSVIYSKLSTSSPFSFTWSRKMKREGERERFLHRLRTYKYCCVNTVILLLYKTHNTVFVIVYAYFASWNNISTICFFLSKYRPSWWHSFFTFHMAFSKTPVKAFKPSSVIKKKSETAFSINPRNRSYSWQFTFTSHSNIQLSTIWLWQHH